MDSETHNDNDQYIITITNDGDSSSSDEGSYSSLSSSPSNHEETSDEIASSFTCGCDVLWKSMDLVVTLVQIVAALVVLTIAKDEHPKVLLLAWLIGYTCGCIINTLFILYWFFTKDNGSDVGVKKYVKMGFESLFVVWIILGIVGICDSHFSPSNAPILFRLCIIFIGFSCFKYTCAVLVCAGHNKKGVFFLPGLSKDDCCCICLGKYGEGEGEIKKLGCSHVFHLECINNWVKIKPTCPLCKSPVMWL